MFPLKRILFPVDFSARARGACVYVEALAGRFDAEITLLHVIEPPTYNSALHEAPTIQPADFDKFFGADLRYLRVERLIERGEAAAKIVEIADQRQVDLIMMPTQGLGRFRRFILGSNTTKVLHDADCAIWTGVHLEDPIPLEAVECKKITCAVDLKPSSVVVLEWARQLADEYQAELTLAHVTPDAASQSKACEKIEDLMAKAKVKASVLVDHGQPSKVVARLAGRAQADVLVIGRRVGPGSSGRLEATAYAIIRQSPCPVVSV
jgi:nucleotide-binding universal stress UspA family protein